jgi:tripartite-type tricarboxylate transporter receptor subunit TctC
MRSLRTLAGVVIGASIALGLPATAAEWPERPITLVVPFAAGSGTDVLGRVVAEALSARLAAKVVVENVGGAGGMNGSARVARAEPDGYQLLLGNIGTHAHNQALYKQPLYQAETDFEPVGLVADLAPILIAKGDYPASDLNGFLAHARSNQDKLQYGSAGVGSAAQLACALVNAKAGLTVVHVPYRGAPLAMQDLVAGRIDYQCALLPSPVAQIQAGQVKAIAILSDARSPALPDVPTAREQGMEGVEASAWHALYLPKGTPAPIVKRLNESLGAALDDPAVREQLMRQGAVIPAPERRSRDYLRDFNKAEIQRWGGTIRAANIVVN